MVLPLVRAINDTGLARTRASCQGHWAALAGRSRPYVAFTCPLATAERMDADIRDAFDRGNLHHLWNLLGTFGTDRQLWFRLSPEKGSTRRGLAAFNWGGAWIGVPVCRATIERSFREDLGRLTAIVRRAVPR